MAVCCWVADRFTATATATACQQFLGFGIVIMLIMQAHACPWRHTDNTANVINHVICFLNQGFMSDNSLACAMRRFPNHFLYDGTRVYDPERRCCIEFAIGV